MSGNYNLSAGSPAAHLSSVVKAQWNAPRLHRIAASDAANGFTQEVKDGQFTRS